MSIPNSVAKRPGVSQAALFSRVGECLHRVEIMPRHFVPPAPEPKQKVFRFCFKAGAGLPLKWVECLFFQAAPFPRKNHVAAHTRAEARQSMRPRVKFRSSYTRFTSCRPAGISKA